jgi:hypothetical protein
MNIFDLQGIEYDNFDEEDDGTFQVNLYDISSYQFDKNILSGCTII